MPLIDLPLAQLQEYRGTNPLPEDFDSYWQGPLEEQCSTPTNVALIRRDFPASFAECFHLRFTGVGDARIYAKYLRPKGSKACPAVLMFHGYSIDSGDWQDKLGW